MKPTVSLSRETLCMLSESLDSCRDHLDLTEGHPVHEVHSLCERCVWLPCPFSFVRALICLRAAINLSSQSLWHPAINRSPGSSRPHLPPSLLYPVSHQSTHLLPSVYMTKHHHLNNESQSVTQDTKYVRIHNENNLWYAAVWLAACTTDQKGRMRNVNVGACSYRVLGSHAKINLA